MKRLQMQELVQEIDLLLDDWHCTKCPKDELVPLFKDCKNCPHFKLCKCLLQLLTIKAKMYNSNGELKYDYL